MKMLAKNASREAENAPEGVWLCPDPLGSLSAYPDPQPQKEGLLLRGGEGEEKRRGDCRGGEERRGGRFHTSFCRKRRHCT